MSPPLPQTVGIRLIEPHPQFDAVIETHDVQRVDISRGADYALVQAEADREILKVLRCRHHDRVGPAVIRNGYRGLFRNRTTA
jgi:hypothetical protein